MGMMDAFFERLKLWAARAWWVLPRPSTSQLLLQFWDAYHNGYSILWIGPVVLFGVVYPYLLLLDVTHQFCGSTHANNGRVGG